MVFAPVFAFCFFWMFVLIYKMNTANIKKYSEWICFFKDLKNNSSSIHIASDNEFPVDYFSIVEAPCKFQIDNFLSLQWLDYLL